MQYILVSYPNLFNCYAKFERKVSKLISRLDSPVLVAVKDSNDFVSEYGRRHGLESIQCDDLKSGLDKCKYAIFFDDGEEFLSEIKLANSLGVKVKRVKIKITRVINVKQEVDYAGIKKAKGYEYIGRGSYWGNPYSMFENGDDRDEVIRKYKYDFEYDKFPNKKKEDVFDLAGKRLGCFCKPKSCHGDVLADFLNSWDDGE